MKTSRIIRFWSLQWLENFFFGNWIWLVLSRTFSYSANLQSPIEITIENCSLCRQITFQKDLQMIFHRTAENLIFRNCWTHFFPSDDCQNKNKSLNILHNRLRVNNASNVLLKWIYVFLTIIMYFAGFICLQTATAFCLFHKINPAHAH